MRRGSRWNLGGIDGNGLSGAMLAESGDGSGPGGAALAGGGAGSGARGARRGVGGGVERGRNTQGAASRITPELADGMQILAGAVAAGTGTGMLVAAIAGGLLAALGAALVVVGGLIYLDGMLTQRRR